jgi:lipopolysaccharide/colanic/teichoic acid biosynthesis glycosyltransferase
MAIFTRSNEEVNIENAMDQQCFIGQLRLEKLRSQRSGTALSLLILSLTNSIDDKSKGICGLLKSVQSKMRESDSLGCLDKVTIGVLLPYTDDKSAEMIKHKIMESCSNHCLSAVAATYPDDIFDSLLNKGCITSDALGLMVENSSHPFGFPLHIKRMIDIVGSITALLILSPLMLFTAAMVKVSSPGPVIFRQNRVGHKGIPFTFYKFRSMRTGASDQIHREYVQKLINGGHSAINNGSKQTPLYKIKSDPRVTPVGRFIRKTSIDELPQLYNVLKGDMTLVGPRPPLPYETENYQAWQLRRILDMKPGITGLWQVEGRGRTEFNEAVRLDIRYVKKWSLLLDLIISCKTIKEVLYCRGAV